MTNTTITVDEETWKKLSMIKINAGYNSIDEVINDLLLKKDRRENK